jgi:hypothetical protein
MPELVNDLVTALQAATFLGVTPGTLSQWRSRKTYPLPYIKTSKVFYRVSDLRKFLEFRTFPGKVEAPKAKRKYVRKVSQK